MEVGCLRHPEASTISSQLLDGDCSYGWKEKQAPITLNKHWKEGGKGWGKLPGKICQPEQGWKFMLKAHARKKEPKIRKHLYLIPIYYYRGNLYMLRWPSNNFFRQFSWGLCDIWKRLLDYWPLALSLYRAWSSIQLCECLVLEK